MQYSMLFRYITPQGNKNSQEHWLCPDAFCGLAFDFQESHQGWSKLPPFRHSGCEREVFWFNYSEIFRKWLNVGTRYRYKR